MKITSKSRTSTVVCMLALAFSAWAACNNENTNSDDAQIPCTSCDTMKPAPDGGTCSWHSAVWSDAYCGICQKNYNCYSVGSHNGSYYIHSSGACQGGKCVGGNISNPSGSVISNQAKPCGS